jgi:hypothetical protein
MPNSSEPLPLLLLAGPALVVTASLLSSPRRRGQASARRKQGHGAPFLSGSPTLRTLALLSLWAGAIHAALAPDHYREEPALGLLFAGVAAAQFVWAAVVVRRPSPALWARGLALHASVALAWLASRTSGLPFGPHAGQAEAVGLLDAMCAGAEVVLAVACIRLLQMTPRLARL